LMQQNNGRDNPWTYAGPDNIGGRITDVETPSNNSSVIYLGAATGGILKSTDAGSTWTNLFGSVPVISVGDIAIDPNNSQVIWCGTGEANASSFSFLGNGIYKSTDGGESWQHTGLTNSAYIGRVIVDYSNSNRIFAAACGNLFTITDERGVYRSDDGGQNWQRILFRNDSTSAIDLVQHPVNPQILYAAMWERRRGLTYRSSFGESSGIWKSTDGGDNWSELTTGLPSGNGVGRIGLAISKSNPEILYAYYDLTNSEIGIYKTLNGGQTWTRTNDGAVWGNSSNFGWYFGQIRIDPTNASRVFVMGLSVYRTENGGSSWSDIGGNMHVDHHAMMINPVTGFIIEGNDGGLYTSNSHGNGWSKINNLPLTQFYAIDIDYLHPQRIYGGTQDNNTIRTLTGGTSDWDGILGGDGMYTLVDYTNSNTIYAESQWGNLNRSTNGGTNMTYIASAMSGDRVNWSAPLAMHPQNSSILYFGTYRIWKSTNKGSSWQAVSGDLTAGINDYFYTVTTIDVSEVNPAIVLAGTGDGKVHVSVNNGQSCQNISAGLPNRWITLVVADPSDAQTIYVTLSGFRWDEPLPHVFKSTNLGQNWTDITGNLPEFPVNDLVVDPEIPGRLFVATDAGLYGTTDGGQNWVWIWDGLPAVPVCALKIHLPTRTLVAGTYGLSCYKASLDNIYTGISSDVKHEKINLSVVPNPVISTANIHFYLPEADKITIKLFSITGTFITLVCNGSVLTGEQNISVNFLTFEKQITEGIYILTIEGTHFKGATKIIII
ncbi:MAG: T9SS type A sorting domain-containing protein, partial [Bacteroidota bacterium]